MITYIVRNEKELDDFITKNGDFNAELAYLALDNESEECFVIIGCTYASEAFTFVNDECSLVITDYDTYKDQINTQLNSEFPDMCGFPLND